MTQSAPRLTGIERGLLAALAAWGLFPLVLLLIHAGHAHARFTGADGLIGADGVLGADQLQYLAWARDAGVHGLASDLFSLAPSGHVYLQPLFTIDGRCTAPGCRSRSPTCWSSRWRSSPCSLAAVAWSRRFFAGQTAARGAAVVLSLFLYTPVAAFFSWTSAGAGIVSLLALPARLRGAGGQQAVGLRPERPGAGARPRGAAGLERALTATGRQPAPGPPPGRGRRSGPRWRRSWPPGCTRGRGSP